jgi:glucosylglycerate synthase
MASTGSNSSVQEAEVTASPADIVVALTSHNDVRTIGRMARTIRDGLGRSFATNTVRFVLADAGSTDGTRDVVRDIVGSSSLVEVEYERGPRLGEELFHGHPRHAAAVRAILQAAQRLEAKACVVIDAGVPTVEPEWVERFIAPVLTGGFDYVSPYYLRHLNEGAITKAIVYPMFRALYGIRLRQPAASEFACSGRLVAHYLEQEFWDLEQASVGIDLWLAVAAVCGEFRTCEAVLGVRGQTSHVAPIDLSTTLMQVLDALFSDLEHRADIWQRVRGSVAVPIFGKVPEAEPSAPPLDIDGLMESFRLGYRELREVWTWVLPPRTIVELRKLTVMAPDRFRFDDRLWASIIYDFALGYTFRVLPRDHLLRSLTPLYSGWLASFVLQLGGSNAAQIEERVAEICTGFESEKRYLISRWRWPERLR